MILSLIKILENASNKDAEMKWEVKEIKIECLEFQQLDLTFHQNSKNLLLTIKIMEMSQMQ